MEFDSDFEDAVLAQALRSEKFLKAASRICQAHHFSTKERSWMWDVVNDNWTKYREKSTPKIVGARAKADFDDTDKRKPYIAQARKLFKLKPKAPNAILAELDKFVRHVGLQIAIEESAGFLEKGRVEDAEKAIAKGARAVTQARNYTHVRWMEEFDERQQKRKHERDHPDEYTTIPLGFPRMDRTLGGGGRKGELALIMGTTGRGKSIFLNNVAMSGISRGYKAILFGFEMPARQIAARQDSRWSQMRYSQFKGFDFKPSELRQLKRMRKRALKQFKNRFHIVSMPVRSANIDDVKNAIEDIRQDYDFEADMILFDSGDHLRSLDQYGGNFRLQQAEVYWSMAALAEEDGYFVVSSTHAGKEWATKTATAEAGSESYDKARIADIIMSINDPNEMKKNGRKTIVSDDDDDFEDDDEIIGPTVGDGNRLMDLYMSKYRDGDSHFKVPLDCDFARMTMKELADGSDEEDDDDDDD